MSTATEQVQWVRDDLSGMIVMEGELTAATGDDSDSPQLRALVPVLNRLRGAFGMEMVFISHLTNGKLGGYGSAGEGCNPFEEAYGRQLLHARCGTSLFDAVQVRDHEGIEAGTLVCATRACDGQPLPADSLKSVSQLLATSMRRMVGV